MSKHLRGLQQTGKLSTGPVNPPQRTMGGGPAGMYDYYGEEEPSDEEYYADYDTAGYGQMRGGYGGMSQPGVGGFNNSGRQIGGMQGGMSGGMGSQMYGTGRMGNTGMSGVSGGGQYGTRPMTGIGSFI